MFSLQNAWIVYDQAEKYGYKRHWYNHKKEGEITVRRWSMCVHLFYNCKRFTRMDIISYTSEFIFTTWLLSCFFSK